MNIFVDFYLWCSYLKNRYKQLTQIHNKMTTQNEQRIAKLLDNLKGNIKQSTTNAVLLCLDGHPQMFESIYRNFAYKKAI